jgi:hypothetical protein
MSKKGIKTRRGRKIPKKRIAWNKNFVKVICHNSKCRKKFETPQWKINQGKGKYCSRQCADQCNTKIGKAPYRFVSPKGVTPPHFRTYIGKENYNWKGGKYLDKDGYVMVLSKKHPNCNARGYVQEHRLVVEELMGRHLKASEQVHHIDGNKKNNHPLNLMVFSSVSAHRRFELGLKVMPYEIIFYIVSPEKGHQMKESKLQKDVKEAIIQKYGESVWFYHPKDRMQVGIPDILMSLKGKFIAIELKRDLKINPVTKIQQHNLNKITKSGALAFSSDSVEDVMNKLTKGG